MIWANVQIEMAATPSPPRLLIIGAGSRGNAYARAVTESTNGIVVSVAEPIQSKRTSLGKRYIWSDGVREEDQEFDTWKDYMRYEEVRRTREHAGEKVRPGFDGVFICVQDALHVEVITGLAPLGLHIMSEKPLATNLSDCLKIYRTLQPKGCESPQAVFSIGHVLRYSPHNMLLRKLLLEDKVIGDVISIEHTEPVGWWHFSHSYVRGNWRKESIAAPSLLTKSCHDIDFLLWLLCPSSIGEKSQPHLPSTVSSTGSLAYFRKSRKPKLAGDATNCLSCAAERECKYSAKSIYLDKHLAKGAVSWPVDIVAPEIEDCLARNGQEAAASMLLSKLFDNYDGMTPQSEVDKRPWFGRCVYEADNDVCDDQVVTMTWDEELSPSDSLPFESSSSTKPRGAKTAIFHMIAFTEKQCERRGRIYGTNGEIEYDSKTIRVCNFDNGGHTIHEAPQPGGGHGGGDDGLTQQYVRAIDAVKNLGSSVREAQGRFIGCSLEDVIRSHAMVFAAEDARTQSKAVNWKAWWAEHVESKS